MRASLGPAPDVLAVYRARNADRLLALLRHGDGDPQRWRLWALDEVAPALASWTVGVGPGAKFELLDRLLEELPADPSRPLVVADDDVRVRRGSLAELCGWMAAAGLGLAQPAHSRRSQSSYRFNRRQPTARVRATTFVEIGPVFAVAGRWREHFLPFPADIGMGWGLELLWQRDRPAECLFGVIDAVTVEHPDYPTSGYAQEEEERRARALMREAGIQEMAEAQQVLDTWWRWQSRPPWRVPPPTRSVR